MTKSNAQAFVDSHRDEAAADIYGITELCREFGITLRALRFYEDKELLAPRRVNGARVYTRRDRARLALILRARGWDGRARRCGKQCLVLTERAA